MRDGCKSRIFTFRRQRGTYDRPAWPLPVRLATAVRAKQTWAGSSTSSSRRPARDKPETDVSSVGRGST